jgi:carnitine O-acetyltransferase
MSSLEKPAAAAATDLYAAEHLIPASLSVDESNSRMSHPPSRHGKPTLNGPPSSSSSTFAAQDQLPRLPIPDLEDTLAKFCHCLQAIQDASQQAETRRVADEFLHTIGPKLQQALKDYDHDGFTSGELGSYVEEFWNESYLAPDASVVLNLNPYFILSDLPDPKMAGDQLRCAASLVCSSLKIASLLKHESLPPDVFKGRPLCMDQFRALLGSSRQPARDGLLDEVHVYNDSSHGT